MGIICRLRVVPLSLSPSSETRKTKPASEWPHDILASCHQDLASHVFFLSGIFTVSFDELSKRGATSGLNYLRHLQ